MHNYATCFFIHNNAFWNFFQCSYTYSLFVHVYYQVNFILLNNSPINYFSFIFESIIKSHHFLLPVLPSKPHIKPLVLLQIPALFFVNCYYIYVHIYSSVCTLLLVCMFSGLTIWYRITN